MNISRLPDVFVRIVSEAFSLRAGWGALAGIAVIGARRAMYVNEAGVGTASLMHGASRNNDATREGLVAMLGPAIDSGFVCTLTAIPIIMADQYHVEGIKGLTIAMASYEYLLPGVGQYLLMITVTIFAFSTMFSYSYYGQKCTGFLFGARYAKYYNYFFLAMLVVAAIIPLKVAVSLIDAAYALMAFPTMFTLFMLAPKARREMDRYFAKTSKKKA
jgi:AGCS family alanine or glycine:cation symporter